MIGGKDPRGEGEKGASRPQTGASRPSTAGISEGGTSIPGLSKDELEELHDAFKMFDKDGDGTIDAAELGTALRSLGQNPNKEVRQKQNRRSGVAAAFGIHNPPLGDCGIVLCHTCRIHAK